MKKIIFAFCGILILWSCSNNTKEQSIEKTVSNVSNSFQINATLSSYLANKVYLNKIFENNLYPIDSAIIKDNKFIFKGIVDYPERFALTFENYSAVSILIIENKIFDIEINPLAIQDPIINNSPLNTLLAKYKNYSKSIFKKINYLFPKFQKARLENDAEKLEEIGNKMKLIEDEFNTFTYDFIAKNSDSFVASMILRDQLKSSTIDTLKITKYYQLLSENVKNGPDAQIIATNLNLH